MIMEEFCWDAESHNFLSNVTKIHQFDFEKVSVAVRERFSFKHFLSDVSAEQCRLAYAQVQAEAEAEADGHPVDERLALDIDDSMSFNQVMDIVEKRNEKNELRKKKAFDRVLVSLGPIIKSTSSESIEIALIKSKIAEAKMQKQHEQSRRNEINANKNEMSRIENEREILRQSKFLPGSGFSGKSV